MSLTLLTEDAFVLPDDGPGGPAAIAADMVRDHDRFVELREGEALILFLMRAEPRFMQDKVELGSMHVPAGFQGKLGPVARWLLSKVCGRVPDFIMLLDQTFWTQASFTQRCALVFHELLHAGVETDKDGLTKFTDDGRPRWTIRPHDLEAFDAEVEQYGAWRSDISRFIAAHARLRMSKLTPEA